MLRQLLPAVLLIPLAIACASGGASPAGLVGDATTAPATGPAAAEPFAPDDDDVAAMTPAAAAAIPTGAARRGDRVYAYVDALRADLSDGKARLINQVMRLSREEATVFWPIYHDYEEELFALGDRRVALLQRYLKAHADGSLDDASAASMSDDWFRFETERLELMRKYQQQIARELSPLRGAQFVQVENRIATIIDLMVASDIPLIQAPARR